MYYPYFRGKQNELILLRDNAEFLAQNRIYPIIEPVKKDFKALKRAMKIINEKKLDCTLIVNPRVGPVTQAMILNELIEKDFKKYQNISLGYIMSSKSKVSDLVDLLRKYNEKN